MSCYWPGNVRELENCVSASHHDQGQRDPRHRLPLPQDRCLTQLLHQPQARNGRRQAPHHPGARSRHRRRPAEAAATVTTREPAAAEPRPATERERLVWAMEQSGWVQAKAARLLNITPRQMGYALQKYKIEIRKF